MNIRIYNARVLTMEQDRDIFFGEVHVKANRISYVGGAENAPKGRWDREIDAKGNVVMPGFKDAHTHSAMTFLRSFADDLPLHEWLNNQIFPMEAKLTPEDIYHLSKLAIMEYLTSGITANFDMYLTPDTIAQASTDCGFRTVMATSVEAIFPIKDIVERPLTWVELWPMLLALVLILVFTALVVYLLMRYNDDKPILRRVTIAPKLPPHQVALQEMERIKMDKGWQKEDVKSYYTELTDALRIYMQERFGFNAMEMTSDEIIDKLNEQQDKEWIDELRTLFNMSDLVKFAKYKPLINENDMNLINAIEFINKTKVEETAPAAPITQEIVVKEGRSKRQRMWILAGIIVLSLCGVYVLYVFLSRVVHVFS